MPNPRVVVSLSTVPKRVQYLDKILNCLLQQTHKPDRIYLNYPKYFKRDSMFYPKLPSNIKSIIKGNPRITVNKCEDLGPITKLYPTLEHEQDPDTIIITVDDDAEYLPSRVETLVDWCQKNPNAAFSGRGIIIGNYWHEFISFVDEPKEPVNVSICEGTAACAYRRKFFDSDIIDYTGAPKDAYYHDDVWISGYLAKRGIDRIVHPEAFGVRSKLPGALSDDHIPNAMKFLNSIRYFREQGLFREIAYRPLFKTLSGAIAFALLIIGIFIAIGISGI